MQRNSRTRVCNRAAARSIVWSQVEDKASSEVLKQRGRQVVNKIKWLQRQDPDLAHVYGIIAVGATHVCRPDCSYQPEPAHEFIARSHRSNSVDHDGNHRILQQFPIIGFVQFVRAKWTLCGRFARANAGSLRLWIYKCQQDASRRPGGQAKAGCMAL